MFLKENIAAFYPAYDILFALSAGRDEVWQAFWGDSSDSSFL